MLVLAGRAHYYEGWSMDEVTFPMRALANLGIRSVLLTNAAGGIDPRFRLGDYMALTDHINFMGVNPLRGTAASDPGCFVDLTKTYDPDLNRLLRRAAQEAAVILRSGVYLAVSGPSYETPAEIRAFARLGADAVGMSTVPEVLVARHMGMRILAIATVTDMATGLPGLVDHVTHEEVLAVADRAGRRLGTVVKGVVRRL